MRTLCPSVGQSIMQRIVEILCKYTLGELCQHKAYTPLDIDIEAHFAYPYVRNNNRLFNKLFK